MKRETRTEAFARGMKAGAVKNTIDKAVSPITNPVVEAVSGKMKEIHPNFEMTAPMVESLLKAALIMGSAEILDIAMPYVDEHTQYSSAKVALASTFMREYAGEKVGTEVVDLALKFVPVIMGAISNLSTEDLKQALPQHTEDVLVPESDFEEEITKENSLFNIKNELSLEEDEEEEEVQTAKVFKVEPKRKIGKAKHKATVN